MIVVTQKHTAVEIPEEELKVSSPFPCSALLPTGLEWTMLIEYPDKVFLTNRIIDSTMCVKLEGLVQILLIDGSISRHHLVCKIRI
jgi:hypothetical protein